MSIRFKNLLVIMTVATSAFSSFCWGSEPAAGNPFLSFLGKYKVTFIDCSINGDPAPGCNLTGVELSQNSDGSLQITEISPDNEEVYPLYQTESRDGANVEKAFITGSSDMATWESDRTFSDGGDTATIKLFARDGGKLFYQAYHRDHDVGGVDFAMKQTYTIELP